MFMKQEITNFIDQRVENTLKRLLQQNGAYAVASERSEELFENIQAIINCGSKITLCREDCMDFSDFLEQESRKASISYVELYRQGYSDCTKLLAMLGILP